MIKDLIFSFLSNNRPAPEPEPEPEVKNKCKLCDEEPVNVTFLPCQHQIVCVDCSVRLKRCVDCNQTINEKKSMGIKNF